ncbi:uncharacterized protein LOC124948708 isoform X2 [Vespa velutina]|uniref:uncharacterized protein LOC124948708 isoform X2 n=1 Tax=Vespa velutina TaxID=202808 RepID=UPI001FB3D8F9|nr:uncharacterized protein LOC124948708 isoform X2 [Vespa velutina]
MSRCEFCNQHFRTQGILSSSQLSAQCTSCSAIIQLLRGGITIPCCPNCNCKTGVLQMEQKKQRVQIQGIEQNGDQNDVQNGDQKNNSKGQTTENQVQARYHQVETTENQRNHSKNNNSRALTSFTKMTVTVHCASPSTTMEVATSTGSKENVVTTYIPLQGPPLMLSNNEKSQNTTQIPIMYQQTENSIEMLHSKDENQTVQVQEIEPPKELFISAAESVELEKYNNENEEVKLPLQIKDSKESTGRKSREQNNSAKQNKRIKRTRCVTLQKDKKDNARTYSRFLPLEDIKTRDLKDVRCNEQDYMQTICMPIIPHEVVEHPHCGRTIMSSVFQRNNRIDPAYMPECETYIAQTENPYIQGEVDTPTEPSTILPIAATTNTDVCTTCKKEKVNRNSYFFHKDCNLFFFYYYYWLSFSHFSLFFYSLFP